ncbi:unnamed protein product [Lupinus luteus]|uniref:Uncharacterized protein n=1 Tax=Lupinus luteus TaxID=3873 RepID=A0AAV1XDL3_LUPLU
MESPKVFWSGMQHELGHAYCIGDLCHHIYALDDKGWIYQLHEREGAFYEPKIDLKIEGALGVGTVFRTADP